jgi:glutamate synthase (NADPH) large chain
MITSHFMYTGSRSAKRILDSWESMLPKFDKVMPVDYKRVLEERKKKAAAGKG